MYRISRLTPGQPSSEEEEEGKGLRAIWQRAPSSKRFSHILHFHRKSGDLVHFPRGRGGGSLPAELLGSSKGQPRQPPRPPPLLKTPRPKPGLCTVGPVRPVRRLPGHLTYFTPPRNVFPCDAVGLAGGQNLPNQAYGLHRSLEKRSSTQLQTGREARARSPAGTGWQPGSQAPCATARNPAIKLLSEDDAWINCTHTHTHTLMLFREKAII